MKEARSSLRAHLTKRVRQVVRRPARAPLEARLGFRPRVERSDLALIVIGLTHNPRSHAPGLSPRRRAVKSPMCAEAPSLLAARKT